jgi:GNAT superfamily N-acetyltransferase
MPSRPADDIVIRRLVAADRNAWEPLWQGYLSFYEAEVPADVTDLSWSRLLDPAEPMHGFGAWYAGSLAGIMHLILHRSMWTAAPYCYLQDLFTAPASRRRGIGRTLIEHAYVEATGWGANRVYWLTHETNRNAQELYDELADRTGFIQYRKILQHGRMT